MSNTAPLFAIGDEVVFNFCGDAFKAVVRGASKVSQFVLVQVRQPLDPLWIWHDGRGVTHAESTPVDGTKTYWYVNPQELRHAESGVVTVEFTTTSAFFHQTGEGKTKIHCLASDLIVTPAQRKPWVKWDSCTARNPARVAVKLTGCESVLRHTPHYNYIGMGVIFLSFDEGETYRKYAFDDVYVETTA